MKKDKILLIISIILVIGILVYSSNSIHNFEDNHKLDSSKMIAYVNGKRTGDIPGKNDGYSVDKVECTNNATGTWDYSSWGILITDLADSETKCSVYFETRSVYNDMSGASYPELYEGLIPVRYNSNGDTVVADLSEEWYDYDEHEWANAVLVTSSARNKEAGETLSQSEILQYFVWIPRYKYKLWNTNNGSSNEQMIEIEFENKNASKSNGTTNGTWLTHPAFTFGNTELNGIWVGKFEMTGGVSTSGTPTNLTIKPNESSLRNMNVSSQFNSLRNMDITYASSYGLNSSEIDTHMMKNMEWGAVAYLTSSKYGRYNSNGTCVTGGCEIWINPYYVSSSTKTGCAGSSVSDSNYGNNCNEWITTNGKHASTTDNQYGIYDMSGGAWEDVLGNVKAGSSTYSWNPDSSGLSQLETKYYDAYTNITSSSSAHENGRLGDATRESFKTLNKDSNGWFSDYSIFPWASFWFVRGGLYDRNTASGIFAFSGYNGSANINFSYRAVLTEQDGSYNGNGLS